MARALGNLIGNCVAIDLATARKVLDGEVKVDVTAG